MPLMFCISLLTWLTDYDPQMHTGTIYPVPYWERYKILKNKKKILKNRKL